MDSEKSQKICKKCGDPTCTGFYLLHEKEYTASILADLKTKELEKDPLVTFNIIKSPSSGELFTKFYELHVLKKVAQ